MGCERDARSAEFIGSFCWVLIAVPCYKLRVAVSDPHHPDTRIYMCGRERERKERERECMCECECECEYMNERVNGWLSECEWVSEWVSE